MVLPALRPTHDYLSNRKQGNGIGHSHSSWFEIIFEVSDRSISGPLLFNIFLAALFFVLKDVIIAKFADDNTTYTPAKNTDELIESIGKASNTLFQRFKGNFLKGYSDKCHLIVSINQKTNVNNRRLSYRN